MAVGDVGADAYGNVTRLSTSQQQYYINLALAKGASRADVDSFIANNGVNDLGRIVSALGLTGTAPVSSSPGPGVGTLSYSAQAAAPSPYVASVAAPGTGDTVALTRPATAADARLSGNMSGGGPAPVNVSITNPGAAAAPAYGGGIPAMWLAVGIGVIVLLALRK